MIAALIGVGGALAGVILGSGIAEIFRRSSRIESYASQVFNKRMQVYEELFSRVADGQSVAEEVMEADKSTKDERHAKISAVILGLAEYCDKNAFYLNEELTVHCLTAFMGAEDVIDTKTAKKRAEVVRRVRDSAASAKKMIKADAGIERIDSFFRKVTRAKLSSPVIEYYRSLSQGPRQ